MTGTPRRHVALILVGLGICAGLPGMGLMGLYVSEAILHRMGEPDQSLLFWYLPVLFLGFVLVGLSVGLLMLGMKKYREGGR